MENKQKPQRQAGKSSVSELFAAPIFAIVLIGAVEIASCQQAQAGTNLAMTGYSKVGEQ